MNSFSRHFKSVVAGLTLAAAAIPAFTSCDAVYEDLDPCPEGVRLRFIYDYNMEFSNAMWQVDCLTVLVYNADGTYRETRTVTDGNLIKDENWRLDIDLPEGDYKIIAYGGMACPQSSFHYVEKPAKGTQLSSLEVALDQDIIDKPTGTDLHELFWGTTLGMNYLEQRTDFSKAIDVKVRQSTMGYDEYNVFMMKDTNVLRILLHNTDNSDVDVNDFTFTITDNNTLFNFNNALLPAPEMEYHPYYTDNLGGTAHNQATGDNIPSFAVAELSTSRFVVNSTANLTIKQISTGREVLSIPLVQYLLYYKLYNPQKYSDLGDQEFLDRKSVWEMSLFLDPTPWGKVTIKIEDWTVRLNDIQDF